MILSAYERADSPWIYIQYAARQGQKKRALRTKIRKDDPDKARKIQIALNHVERDLLTAVPGVEADDQAGDSWLWVPSYLRSRYGASGTHTVYSAQWAPLSRFLVEHGIRRPSALTREHCLDLYLPWRQAKVKQRSGRTTKANTAIGELKLLAVLMDEAIARGLAETNPARKLKLHREETIPKPEITAEEAGAIYRALQSRPVWMQRSFHIALQTGVRFSETQIRRSQILWDDSLVHIEKPKGGRKRAFSIPIYPQIETMLRDFWESGAPVLWEVPAKERALTGLTWTKFFREIGLPHLCFHCTRVTFITTGARAGIPESAMMAMVNHASKEIHRIYQRFRGSDALRFRSLMQLPAPPSAQPVSGATK